ncbi:MAG: HAD-IG family 5'-nucleotidase, partial [Bacteriovoracia bacterium]
YNETHVEELAFQGAIDYLVDHLNYPQEIRKLKFSGERIIRGLVIDKKLGNLIKINRFGYIKAALHGDHFLTLEEQKKVYGNEIVTFSNPRYEMVHTMFSLAVCSLYCQMVDRFHGPENKETYEDLFVDCTNAVDLIHRNGWLKDKMMANPSEFVVPDPLYAETLKQLKHFGKKLVLITNSEWKFCDAMMSFCYDRFLEKGQTWRDLFEVIIVSSSKPSFFISPNSYFEVDPTTGFLKNVSGGIQTGKIYQGGNSQGVETLFNVSPGEILFVGDHVYSDVHQSKKIRQWRTMLVISELEGELRAAMQGYKNLSSIRELMKEKEELELQLDQVVKKLNGITYSIVDIDSLSKSDLKELQGKYRQQIVALDEKLGGHIEAYNSHFNPHWGELLWAGNDQSQFGMTVERFACIYTSKVSNLLHYSPTHYFRPKIKSYF